MKNASLLPDSITAWTLKAYLQSQSDWVQILCVLLASYHPDTILKLCISISSFMMINSTYTSWKFWETK